MHSGDKTYIWHQELGAYKEVSGFDESSQPIWLTESASLKPVEDYAFYLKYFYETDLDCYTQKYDIENNEVGEVTRYPGCVLYQGDLEAQRFSEIDCPELPESKSVESLIEAELHFGKILYLFVNS